jgi:hypothetical protein
MCSVTKAGGRRGARRAQRLVETRVGAATELAARAKMFGSARDRRRRPAADVRRQRHAAPAPEEFQRRARQRQPPQIRLALEHAHVPPAVAIPDRRGWACCRNLRQCFRAIEHALQQDLDPAAEACV